VQEIDPTEHATPDWEARFPRSASTFEEKTVEWTLEGGDEGEDSAFELAIPTALSLVPEEKLEMKVSAVTSTLRRSTHKQMEWYRQVTSPDKPRWPGQQRRAPNLGVTVDGQHERYHSVIDRWVSRQHDLGKAAVVVDPFGGQLYRSSERKNVVSVTMHAVNDIQQLQDIYDCVLVIGRVDATQLSSLRTLMDQERTLHFLVDVDYQTLPSLESYDLFLDPELRVLQVERGCLGAWSVIDEVAATVSTLPLMRYEPNVEGIPEAVTVKHHHKQVTKSWVARLRSRANSTPIPTYAGSDLPTAPAGSFDEFISML
jgi:hypothetical protein